MYRTILCLVCLILLPWHVLAAPQYPMHHEYPNRGLFMGINIGEFTGQNFSRDGFTGATLKLGFDIDNFIALEAHIGGSTWEMIGPAYEERIAQFNGLFLRTNLPLERHKVYALLGYGSFEFEVSERVQRTRFADIWESSLYEEQGGSYGLGLDLFVGPRSALNLQYMRYLTGGENLLNISVGFRLNFY